jgi:hypothetical protein
MERWLAILVVALGRHPSRSGATLAWLNLAKFAGFDPQRIREARAVLSLPVRVGARLKNMKWFTELAILLLVAALLRRADAS